MGNVLTKSNTVAKSTLVKHYANIIVLSEKSSTLVVPFRNFKTVRNIEAQTLRNPSLFMRVFSLFGFDKKSKSVNDDKLVDPRELNKTKSMLATEELSIADQQKLKIAVYEDYLTYHMNNKPGNYKWFWKVFKDIGFIIIYSVITAFSLITLFNNNFSIDLGNNSEYEEIDPEVIKVTFNDIKGIDEAKEELKHIVELLKNPKKCSSLGGVLPKGVLLEGPPGTGKTTLARAVAGEAGVPFFNAPGPEFISKYVGEGARRVRELFKLAKERAPCVIFIDEIDSVGHTRTNSALHPHANDIINQLLCEMDGFHQSSGVIVFGATNQPGTLDKALLRPGRFDVVVSVAKPDYLGRKEILTFYLQKICAKDINVEILARETPGFTPADLKNMINQAALKAAIDEAEFVTMNYLEMARDDIIMGPECKSKIFDEECNVITANHEGGHVVVAYFTKDSQSVHKVSIESRGASLGHTSFVPQKESYHINKSQLLAVIDVSMGGRVAEELVLGSDKITTGAISDLKEATTIATQMVKKWGMSERAGLRTFYDEEERHKDMSSQTASFIDSEIQRILKESYNRAKTILKTHKKEHQMLVQALLKYKTLDADDIKTIMSGKMIEEKKAFLRKRNS